MSTNSGLVYLNLKVCIVLNILFSKSRISLRAQHALPQLGEHSITYGLHFTEGNVNLQTKGERQGWCSRKTHF